MLYLKFKLNPTTVCIYVFSTMSPKRQLKTVTRRVPMLPRTSTGLSGTNQLCATTRSMLNEKDVEDRSDSVLSDAESQTSRSTIPRKGSPISPLSGQQQKRSRTTTSDEMKQIMDRTKEIMERMDMHAEQAAKAFESLGKWQSKTDESVAKLQSHNVVVDDRLDRMERQADITIRGVPLTGM